MLMNVWATGAQLRAARALLRIKQRDLATQLGVSVLTVQRAEDDYPGSVRTKRQLQQWLAHEGIEFGADGSIRQAPAAPPQAPPAPLAAPAVADVIERRGGLVRRNGMWWPAPRTA
jgi:transcriptional regulator with XRE-family HTH domain